MTVSVWILVFAGLSVLLAVCLYIAMSKNAALQFALQTTQLELKNYSPIMDVELEVSERRRKLEAEIAAAMQQIGTVRQELDAEINRKRLEIESQIKSANSHLDVARQEFEAEVNRKRQNVESEIMTLNDQLVAARQELALTEARLQEYDLKVDMEEMGFYQPKFDFEDSFKYAEALDLTREAQKELIRQKLVLDGVSSNTTTAMKRLGILGVDAFNGEATTIISKVSYSNFEASKEKLRAEFDKINRLLDATGMRISQKYLDLKVKEMAIAYDYREAEERAKQEQAEVKEMMREEEDAREEAESLREKAMEEERRYQQALATAREELASHAIDDREAYEKKIQELETQLLIAKAERERATSMAQITKKGHVYIISNFGSFGEGVLKIGLTRRTEPDQRIRELGDASVPFGFDVHALVHADDAPALEAALHNYFKGKRMNKANLRKEFFRVSIDEIEEACTKLGFTIRLSKLAEARDYRATLELETKVSI